MLDQNSGILLKIYKTLQGIATVLEKHPNTIRNWISNHGFPAARTPGGVYITTDQLINQWIMARAEVSANQEREPS